MRLLSWRQWADEEAVAGPVGLVPVGLITPAAVVVGVVSGVCRTPLLQVGAHVLGAGVGGTGRGFPDS